MELKAKDTSHIGMIVGALCIACVFVVVMYKFLVFDTFNLSIENSFALILIGISPSIPFSPIYISMWIDKIAEFRRKKEG